MVYRSQKHEYMRQKLILGRLEYAIYNMILVSILLGIFLSYMLSANNIDILIPHVNDLVFAFSIQKNAHFIVDMLFCFIFLKVPLMGDLLRRKEDLDQAYRRHTVCRKIQRHLEKNTQRGAFWFLCYRLEHSPRVDARQKYAMAVAKRRCWRTTTSGDADKNSKSEKQEICCVIWFNWSRIRLVWYNKRRGRMPRLWSGQSITWRRAESRRSFRKSF